jgi:cell wall-associated NlpC family hydrolase
MGRFYLRAVLWSTLLTAGCASTGAVPKPFPAPGAGRRTPPAASEPSVPAAAVPAEDPAIASETLGGVAQAAVGFVGVPYRNGGSDPAGGFDCSGLVWYVFAQRGIPVPRTVVEQFRGGASVEAADLRAGDLVFFNTTGGGPSHVGISLGGEQFVHAPNSSGEVRIERLSAGYWAQRFIGIRRFD